MPKLIDISGKTFNRWTVLNKAKSKRGKAYWNCVCECGNKRSVDGGDLRRGASKSCGCLQKETISGNAKHGHNRDGKRTSTYQTWRDMKRRCEDSKHRNFHTYGGVGIIVCKRWKDFINFLNDMGERPEGKTLDRIDNSKNYIKSNCKWSTPKEQANNMSRNRMLEYNGKTKTMSEWADYMGMPYQRLNSRIFNGWSVKRALTTK